MVKDGDEKQTGKLHAHSELVIITTKIHAVILNLEAQNLFKNEAGVHDNQQAVLFHHKEPGV